MSLAPESAAAFSLAALTAWRMCVTRARVGPGDDVLIWGIGGGVAQMALAICKAYVEQGSGIGDQGSGGPS